MNCLSVIRRQFDYLCGTTEDFTPTVEYEVVVGGNEGKGDG